MCAQCLMGAVAGFGVYQAYKHVFRGKVDSVYQRVRNRPNGTQVFRGDSPPGELIFTWDPWPTTAETSESEVSSDVQKPAGG